MPSVGSLPLATAWLAENGPKELELLFRAIVYHPSVPILIADNDRHYRDASSGAGNLGLPRDEIIKAATRFGMPRMRRLGISRKDI